MSRLLHAWRALDRERRIAAMAALGLFVSMFLPWYQQNTTVNLPKSATPLLSRNLNAFQVFSFVEAAVLLVSLALLFLLFARAEGREFDMPGGDGTVVLAGGIWAALLLVLRLFDKPGISAHGVAGNVGVQWGIFFALAAAGAVSYSGSRMRAAGRPRAPLRRSASSEPERPSDAFAPEPYAATERAQPRVRESPPHREDRPDRPRGEDIQAAAVPAEAETTVLTSTSSATPAPRAHTRYPPGPASAEQLSFEEPDPGAE